MKKTPSSTRLTLEGSHIDKLQQYTDHVHQHSTVCEGSIALSDEIRHGLASIITGECSTCPQTLTFETSNKVKGPRGYSR